MRQEFQTRDLAHIFYDCEIYASLSQTEMGCRVAVQFRKGLHLEDRLIFLNLESRLIVLDVSEYVGSTFNLVAIYDPDGGGSQISSEIFNFSLRHHCDVSGMVLDFTCYLSGMLHFSVRDSELCKMLIRAEDIWNAMRKTDVFEIRWPVVRRLFSYARLVWW